ncbi:MAG: hypothetical protein KGL39_03515 [Patescibacteria group bacterium]|nr:hypothetical protein [Patescibacteria group bacterium]
MIKSFSMPQPMMDELTSIFLASGEDRRSQVNEPLKHLWNTGFVTIFRVEDRTSVEKFLFTVRLTDRALQFLQVAFDIDIEMSWQAPKEPLPAPPEMPRPDVIWKWNDPKDPVPGNRTAAPR